jgi:hypothetical protein
MSNKKDRKQQDAPSNDTEELAFFEVVLSDVENPFYTVYSLSMNFRGINFRIYGIFGPEGVLIMGHQAMKWVASLGVLLQLIGGMKGHIFRGNSLLTCYSPTTIFHSCLKKHLLV